MRKTIAIIGAGPGGLVAAKTLLSAFAVTVFDKQATVGGLWAVSRDRPTEGMLNPDMPANVSRFSLGFTDLAWSSVGLGACPPYYPRAWQVGAYLRAYAAKYLPAGVLRLGTRVTRAEREHGRWRVWWDGGSAVFDYLVVGAGFFAAPAEPAWAARARVPVVHSSRLRSLAQVGAASPRARGTVLVVGGGMSGVDCAATVLAAQVADARYKPDGDAEAYRDLEIVHAVTAPFYALPLVAPLDKSVPQAPTFAPLDTTFYDLGRRPPGEIDLAVGRLPEELTRTYHDNFTGLVGDQADLAGALVHERHDRAAHVALTDAYPEFVRSGDIKLAKGRVVRVDEAADAQATVVLQSPDGAAEQPLERVVGIVNATGFDHAATLDFLPADVRAALEHEPAHPRLPVILDKWSCFRREVPGLAFVGYHEGPFWLAMELQAKLIAHTWTTGIEDDDASKREAYRQTLRDLRTGMAQRAPDIGQYWMGDYVGYIESLARHIGLARDDSVFPERTGPVVLARYAGTPADAAETHALSTALTQDLRATAQGRFVARATFRSLQGRWTLTRQLDSQLDFFPSGRLTGSASFHPRAPTDAAFDGEYLYVEQGTLTTAAGLTLQASRRYVYRFAEATDAISVWFVKEDGVTVDYLFHTLKLDPKDRERGWVAHADHLCSADMYTSRYCFRFRGAVVPTFNVVHSVKGPRKDYVSDTWYERGSAA